MHAYTISFQCFTAGSKQWNKANKKCTVIGRDEIRGICKKKWQWGFPGRPVVKNPPANAGDTVLTPDLGGSHMPQRTKPVCHSYWGCALQPGSSSPTQARLPWSPCSARREATTMRSPPTQLESSPWLRQLGKDLEATEDPEQPTK